MLEKIARIPVDRELTLRVVESADAQPLFRTIEANRAHLRRWLPWVEHTPTVREVEEFIADSVAQLEAETGTVYLILHRDEIAGVLSLYRLDWANRRTEIGYWLAAPLQGHGIMTRSCRALLRVCFELLALHRATIYCATGNHRSRSVAERLGFDREGVMKQAEWLNDHFEDLVVYGLVAPEWKKLR
ncbi:MAG: GNAT family N-acetyltransferase [Candidatus Xenobia bacterium]